MNRNCKLSNSSKSSFKSPVASQFKSPLRQLTVGTHKESCSELKEEIAVLKQKLQEAESEIKKLRAAGFQENELQAHINKLHEYNEIKDVGQLVLGRIAVLEGVQTKDMYPKYGLNLND